MGHNACTQVPEDTQPLTPWKASGDSCMWLSTPGTVSRHPLL